MQLPRFAKYAKHRAPLVFMMSRKSKAQKAGHPASGGLGFAAHTLRKVREAWDTPCVYDVKEIKSPTVWAPGGTRRFMADVNPTIDQVLSRETLIKFFKIHSYKR